MQDQLWELCKEFIDDEPTRLYRALLRDGIFTLEDLENASDERLRKIHGIGPERFAIVKAMKDFLNGAISKEDALKDLKKITCIRCGEKYDKKDKTILQLCPRCTDEFREWFNLKKEKS